MLSQDLILQLQDIIQRNCNQQLPIEVVRSMGEAYVRFYEVLIKMDKEQKEQEEKDKEGQNEPADGQTNT